MKLKKLYSVVLAGLMAFPLVGCKSDELQSKIDDLQAKIAQQEQTIAGLQTQNAEQAEKITDLENKNSQQADRIANLEKGTLYTLEEAYEAGELTQEHLLYIAYFSGAEEQNKHLMDWSFYIYVNSMDPKSTKSEFFLLKEALAEFIRNDDCHDAHEFLAATDFTISYFGCYNGYYAFMYDDALFHLLPEMPYPTREYQVGGVTFLQTYRFSKIMLWKYS